MPAKRFNIHARDIIEGDTLHLGTPSRPEDFTCFGCRAVLEQGQTRMAADVGEGVVYFAPFELVPVTREG